MRILVTGAGGFVGRHVACALADKGHSVLATVHRTVPDALVSRENIEVKPFDLAAETAFRIDGGIDAVIHCAAALPSTIADAGALYRTNVNGMKQLLAASVNSGAKSFVNCSSMSIYGRISVPVVDENTPSVEPDAYGSSKLESENLLRETAQQNGMAAVSIRLPGVVGLGSHDNFLSNVMARIVSGEPVQAKNPDALFNNIVHVADLAGFMADRVNSMDKGHRTTLIAAGEPIPIKRVISSLFAEAGQTENVTYSQGGNPFLIDVETVRRLGFAVPSTLSSVRRFAKDCAGPTAVT